MRGYNRGHRGQGFRYNHMPALTERIISALSYLTMGLVGFIWLIISFVMGKQPSFFVRFHAFQAIFISIILYIFNIVLSILMAFIKIIPFIGDLIMNLVYYLSTYPLIMEYSLTQFILVVFIIYLAISALLGRYSYVPWVSDNINKLIR